MSTAYLESSALLLAVLQGHLGAAREIADHERLVASTLTFLEGHRALLRALNAKALEADVYTKMKRQIEDIQQSCALREIDDAILVRARRPFFVEPVRSLDAIHLATIEMAQHAGLDVVLATDPRIARNAEAMGVEVRPEGGADTAAG